MQTAMAERDANALGAERPVTGGLLDLGHLDHQTLGDTTLRREVLQLFLSEVPKIVADLKQANDVRAWRMALHTIKGVALNLGAFQLARQCRHFEQSEGADVQSQRYDAARAIATLVDETRTAINSLLGEGSTPRV